jgi:hypothetical protein
MSELWKELSPEETRAVEKAIQDPALTLAQRAAKRLKLFLERERIVKNPGERIYAWRTIPSFPDIYAPGERERLQAGRHVHEQGRVCNISSDWAGVLTEGLLPRRERTTPEGAPPSTPSSPTPTATATRGSPRAVRTGAASYPEALNAFRILHFSLWASNVYTIPWAALTSTCGPFSGPTWKRA